jgi:phosphatidylglycerophosphate synthase
MDIILYNLKLIPNQITAVRFLLVPIMWIMSFTGFSNYLGICLIICFFSDALDGHLARRLKQTTEFGARFDSLADNILIPSSLIWLLLFKPAVFIENPVLSILAIGTYTTSIIVGWVKFKQFGNLHLYLSKLSGLVQYVFIIHTFLASQYSYWLYYLTTSIFFLSSLETLILQLVRTHINEQMGSILCVYHLIDCSKLWRSLCINSQVQQLGANVANRHSDQISAPAFLYIVFRLFSVLYGAPPYKPVARLPFNDEINGHP